MSIITVCRAAWQSTKQDHQPDFDDLIPSYQNMLQQRAAGAIASGVANNAGPLASFDLAAIRCNAAMSDVSVGDPIVFLDSRGSVQDLISVEVKEELAEEAVVEAQTPKKLAVKKAAKKVAK